jgi:hypothetical protein
MRDNNLYLNVIIKYNDGFQTGTEKNFSFGSSMIGHKIAA